MRPRVLERGAGALFYTICASVPVTLLTFINGHSLQCIEGVFCLIVIRLVISFWLGWFCNHILNTKKMPESRPEDALGTLVKLQNCAKCTKYLALLHCEISG